MDVAIVLIHSLQRNDVLACLKLPEHKNLVSHLTLIETSIFEICFDSEVLFLRRLILFMPLPDKQIQVLGSLCWQILNYRVLLLYSRLSYDAFLLQLCSQPIERRLVLQLYNIRGLYKW